MKKNISLSLDEELIERVGKICRVSERTKSWFVKKAVENYLEEIEDVEIAAQKSLDPITEFITEDKLKRQLKKEKEKI